MKQSIIPIVLITLLVLGNPGIGEDKLSEVEAARKYRGLIAELASPNEKPITSGGQAAWVKFPAGYDVAAQSRVDATRQELHDNLEEALPYLVEALNDKRYCMTINWADGERYYNKSVGDICRDVMQSQLEVYRDSLQFAGPGHFHDYDYDPFSEAWAKERQGRRLADLQVEAIDWAIEQRKKDTEYPKLKSAELANLRQLRTKINTSGKPAKSQGMFRMVISDR